MNKIVNKKTVLLMNLMLAQVLVVVINGMWGTYASARDISIPLSYIIGFSMVAEISLIIAAIYVIKGIIRLSNKEAEAEVITVNLKKNEELLDILRTQRHDFLNHLQVIYGLVHLKKTEKLSSYIGELTNDMETENRLSSLACAEFTAFLLRKKSSAIEQGIKFDLDIFTDLLYAKIPASELVSIVGNLIDNAFYAVKENPHNDSGVLLTIDEEDETYVIYVANTGNQIPEDMRGKIFKQGFTTKGDKGTGYGLHIVKELAEKNKGTIELVDEPGFSVCFQLILPKSIRQAKVG